MYVLYRWPPYVLCMSAHWHGLQHNDIAGCKTDMYVCNMAGFGSSFSEDGKSEFTKQYLLAFSGKTMQKLKNCTPTHSALANSKISKIYICIYIPNNVTLHYS